MNAEDLILENTSVTMYGDHTYETVHLTSSTINVDMYNGFDDGRGYLRIYASSIILDNNSSINANGSGGYHNMSTAETGDGNQSAAGGAGYGGVGGNGGNSTNNGGNIYGTNQDLNLGSRGAAAIYNTSGGMGGGAILLVTDSLQINSSNISANGNDGDNGNSGNRYGNGGGSGGHIIINTEYFEIINSTLSVKGGNGGNYCCSDVYEGGGGGGSGRIFIKTHPFEYDDSIFNLLGGAGGNGGSSGYDGSYGQDGVPEIEIVLSWVTSSTHPEQELYYVSSTPSIQMDAEGDIYGYFYSIDQNPDGIADDGSTFTLDTSLTLDLLTDGIWYFHAVPMNTDFLILEDQHMTYQLNIKSEPLLITSSTHPNQDFWYDNSNPFFDIETIDGIDDYYYIFNEDPDITPTDETGTFLANSTLILPGVSDGTYWLHVVGVDDIGAVGANAAHFQVNIGSPQATISLSNDSLDFGEVYTTSTSIVLITVANMGNGDLEISSISLSDEVNFSVDPNSLDQLGEGESTGLNVTFHPQDTLNYSSSLIIQSNDPNNSEVSVVLSGNGSIEPFPEISVEPDSIDFGSVIIDEDSTQYLTIYNGGDSDLIVSSISLVLGDVFSYTSSITGMPISPDSVGSFLVHFNPTESNIFSDTIKIMNNDPSNPIVTIPLAGIGMNPPIDLEIPTMDVFANDSISVPINFLLPEGVTISSFLIEVGGNINSLTFLGIETESTLIGNNDWSLEVNATDSLIVTASAGANDIDGSGVLFYMRFHIPDTATGFLQLNIVDALFDTGETGFSPISGGINVIVPEYGDIDINGEIQPYDASLILKYLVDYIELDYHQQRNADVSLDNTVSALDASLILQYTVGLIDTLPYSDTIAFFAYGDIGMQDNEIVAGQIVDVPIYLTNGENILGFEGFVSFNPDHLIFSNILWSELLNDFTIEENIIDGEILIAGAGSLPDGQEGVFATLQFEVDTNFSEEETLVSISRLRWNEEESIMDVAIATLTQMNFAPTIDPIDDLSTNEDTPVAIEISVFDENGDSLTINVVSSDENVIPELDGYNLNLNLEDNWYGNANITVTVSDNEFDVSEVFTLVVHAVNDAPQSFATIGPVTETIITLTAETINDTLVFSWEPSIDVDGDELIYSISGMDQLAGISSDSLTAEEYSISYMDLAEMMQENELSLMTGIWMVSAQDEEYVVDSEDSPELTIDASQLSLDLIGLPTVFALHQNYPNPFNPTTTLRYDLPVDALVNITIYDIMGRSIWSLVNSRQTAGYRSIQWNATNNLGEPVSAGMYIYTIQAGDFRQTKKMVLLK